VINGRHNSGKVIKMDIKASMAVAIGIKVHMVVVTIIGNTATEIEATMIGTGMGMVNTTIALLVQWFGGDVSTIM